MSVFRGSISEYPGVIVDHFILANCEKGRIFFLSHCHRDHMTGLSSPNIVTALQKSNTNLLCSEVTRSLLVKDPEFTQLAPYLKGLPMEEPVAMSTEIHDINKRLSFTVTLLPAGHCPGSSMFLFQGSKGNVLYTGDFRLTLEETKRLRPLHCGESLLDVSTLYVDTTFCHPIAAEIPSRDTSRDLILKLIESWLAKDPTNVVHLQCNMFGYEHVFMGVYKKFKTKIHIAPWKMNAYREISAVTDCLTTDGESTQIHACTYRKGQKGQPGLPCGSCQINGTPPNVVRIKPSTQWFLFNNKSSSHPCVFVPQFNKFRVIHSMHASYKEVCDFITYIKPRRIVPCVIPSGDTSLSDVCKRLKGLLPQSEVSSAYTDTKKVKNKSKDRFARKKPAENSVATQTMDSEDSWSTGDESIDEFTSTGEQTSLEETEAFTHTQTHNTYLSLPSLIAVENTRGSTPPSSDSAPTLGSLKQSPIDLSLDSTPSSIFGSQTNNTCPASSIIPGKAFKPEENSSKVSDSTLDDSVKKEDLNCKQEDSANETVSCWSLKYECSPSYTGSTPPSKKARLSETVYPVSCKLFEDKLKTEFEQGEALSPINHSFIDLTQDEESYEEQKTDCLFVSTPPEMIDLTHDHHTPTPDPNDDSCKDITLTEETLSNSNDIQSHACTEIPEQSPTTTCTKKEVSQNIVTRLSSPIELSDSQGSGSTVSSHPSVESGPGYDPFGSPNCLPPTPGRENIHSILQRSDFP